MVRWRRWWWTRTWWLRPPLPEVSHSSSTGQGKVKGHNESNTAFLIYPFITTQFTTSIVSGADLKMGMRIRSLLKTCVFVIHMTLQWVRYEAESKQPLPKYIPKRALEIIGWRFFVPVQIRVICEIVLVVWSLLYLIKAAREATFLERKVYIQSMALCPSR